jgi:calcium-dependent protein kinase
MELKLIDFGVSKRFLFKKGQPPRDMWTRTGNIFYQAPEIFEGGGYDEKGNETNSSLLQSISGRWV